jgi:HlyD family secretion protein
MADNPLFRKAALDKLASPERLDVLMRVTSPMGWLALLTIAGILAGVIVWSLVGAIPERIDGQGILLKGGGLLELRSSGTGTLVSVSLKLNDVVQVGQVVGAIASDADEDVAVARRRVDELRSQLAGMAGQSGVAAAQARAEIARLEGEVGRLQAELQAAEANVERLRGMLSRGEIPASRVEGAEGQARGLRGNISSVRSQIAQQQSIIRSASLGEGPLRAQLGIAEQELQRAMAKARSQEQVTSTVAGRIIELKKVVGDTLRANDVIATVEPLGSDVQVIAFVSADVGKRIQTDMATEVSPTQVKRAEYGFMRANVVFRPDFAASPDYVMNTLRNEAVAKKLIGSGPVFEVRAALKETPATPSGFEWSTSEGPPFKIGGGTMVNIAIIVDRKRPITLVMPFLRKTFGVA